MGKRGPQPKPQALKHLHGTHRPDRDSGLDNVLDQRKPYCPAWLDGSAKAEWKRIATPLHDVGLLKYVDRAALAAYCTAYSRWEKAEKLIQKSGLLMKTQKGNIIQNPAVGTANVAMRQMMKILKEFGMTPSSRARLMVNNDGELKEESLADILFQAINSE